MKNKIIVITGAFGKIGFVVASSLLEQGHSVVLSDINLNLKKYNSLKIKFKNSVEFFKSNITKSSEIDKLIKFTLKKFLKINTLIHCAYPKNSKFTNLNKKIDEKNLSLTLYNHLGATIIISQKFLNYFQGKKSGKIIFFSSIQGISSPKFEHYKGTLLQSPIEYSAIKSGIVSITKYLAKYSKNKNININCISPGGIIDNQSKIFVNNYRKSCLNKGLLDPLDITGTVSFLISDNSKYINGQNIIIDDGWSL
tara:strand:- start:1429 stop:2187 length:759 start_codon:yes stop_codon:yes gene_type:complete